MDMMRLIIIAIIVDAIVSGIFSCYLATLKDYSPPAWFFIGLIFGIFGLITAVGLPLKKDIIPNYVPSEKYIKNVTQTWDSPLIDDEENK